MTNVIDQENKLEDEAALNAEAEETQEEEAPVDELSHLKNKADLMGIKYASRIGVDKLREKINSVLNNDGTATDPDEEDDEDEKVAAVKKKPAALSKHERVAAIRKKMNEDEMFLVRLRISNLNPSKKDLEGEFFTVVNKYLGTVRKFIPYGEASDNGYHVPNIIYKEIKSRKFNSVRTKTINGQIHVIQKWVPEFALDVMEPLTLKEIKDLAASQAASRGTE